MVTAGDVKQGYFSVLRWRSSAARDEERNVAVLLAEEAGEFGSVRSAPLSAISPSLHEQGVLDAAIHGLVERCERDGGLHRALLDELHQTLVHSLVVSQPLPVAVGDVEQVTQALYKIYLAPRSGGRRALTKGVLLDQVVSQLRGVGADVRRGAYLNDFLFDVIVEGPSERRVIEVLSFAAARKDWTPTEKDAGHFLYAMGESSVPGTAVILGPGEAGGSAADASYERVRRWFEGSDVPVMAPDEVGQLSLTS